MVKGFVNRCNVLAGVCPVLRHTIRNTNYTLLRRGNFLEEALSAKARNASVEPAKNCYIFVLFFATNLVYTGLVKTRIKSGRTMLKYVYVFSISIFTKDILKIMMVTHHDIQ